VYCRQNNNGVWHENGRWLIVLGLLTAATAAAQFNVGGSVGYTQFKDVCEVANVPCDDNDTD
jgi:hypothetical protein